MVLPDEQWAVLGLLVEACRLRGKTPLRHLQRTVEGITPGARRGADYDYRRLPNAGAIRYQAEGEALTHVLRPNALV
jgi:hypothetical protein